MPRRLSTTAWFAFSRSPSSCASLKPLGSTTCTGEDDCGCRTTVGLGVTSDDDSSRATGVVLVVVLVVVRVRVEVELIVILEPQVHHRSTPHRSHGLDYLPVRESYSRNPAGARQARRPSRRSPGTGRAPRPEDPPSD